jgi:hypothetical protein
MDVDPVQIVDKSIGSSLLLCICFNNPQLSQTPQEIVQHFPLIVIEPSFQIFLFEIARERFVG